MTAGVDGRPLTSSGSIRVSDILHDRALHTAMLEKQEQTRRANAAEVREQIEDFEHKMGWKMRKHLGPCWAEQRALELEEERTMGLKRQQVPRPPSPTGYYDYAISDPTAGATTDFEMMQFRDGLDGEGSSSALLSHNARPATSYESARPMTKPTNRSMSAKTMSAISSKTMSAISSRPWSVRPNLAKQKGAQELWTAHSMLEPIFLP
eukprot:CAMPEP_0181347754 /NCGR_PEP_ID=MMETSP1101-20121128/34046_1 /TAXON_ID=46948 /ORGANISM="Rhodomonas abbreviata, Strain Caron Lab Isolate" /LENGTH=207 /DNA_ID=CAMNT_0023459987 /DNA_START=127 /DNA_END=747 /DNA_ORIENTATION=+